jgi:hypothetical protein
MGLSSLINRAIPAITGFVKGGPVGAFAGAAQADRQLKEVKKQKQIFAKQQADLRRQQNMDPYLQSYYGNTSVPALGQGNNSRNGGFGATFGTFLGDVGKNILGPIGNIFSSPALTPFITPQSIGQPAQPSQGQQMGQETSKSGTQEAFMGGLGNILGQAGRLLRTPAGQVGTGGLIGLGANMLSGSSPSMRITRKMKSQYRAVLNLAGGNYQVAADMIGVSDDMFIQVMLKRFRNDGPVVTKAALRKTKTTVRRLKSMCDMYDSLRPTATRRRSPMKRAGTTLISNK